MSKTANAWLRSFVVLTLLPATMANKGGCAPDVEMGDDGEVGGEASTTSVNGKGGATNVGPNSNGGSSVESYPEKGGAATVSYPAKGGASAISYPTKGGASALSYPTKGGASTLAYCEKDKCGMPPSETCPNGSITAFNCVQIPSGECVWQVEECPASAMCSKDKCGEQPPFEPCGGDLGGAVVCEPDATGKCQWQQRCPEPKVCLPSCNSALLEQGTCPDGTLKRYHCGFVGAYASEKYAPCAELTPSDSAWIEEPCLTAATTCNDVDEVLVLAGYLTTNLEKTNYYDNPTAAQALCAEAFRQPTGGNAACIYAQQGYSYEFRFLDYQAPTGASVLTTVVFPHGECPDMTTQVGATTTVRTPTEGLWSRIADVVGIDLRKLPKK